jgi:hypothetical protein
MWIGFSARHHSKGSVDHFLDIANKAAQWGADQELEACCEWLCNVERWKTVAEGLRTSRRPKPPSLKELALKQLVDLERVSTGDYSAIRRALEALPE